MQLREAIRDYLSYRHDTGRAASTRANNRQALYTLEQIVGGSTPVERFGLAELEAWQRSMRHLDPGTVRGRISSVSSFLVWCQRHRHRADNPALQLQRPRLARRVVRAMPDEVVDRVLAAARTPRDRLCVSLMLREALRAKEVVGLDFADLDLAARVLFVAEGKGGHQREVPMTAATLDALELYLAEHPPAARTGPVVRHYVRGTRLRPDYMSRVMSRLMYRAGVKAGPRDGVSGHALRHTCLANVADRTGNIMVVQEIAGHASISTSQVYTRRVSRDAMRAALDPEPAA